ncbi:class 1 isoprenoid biosynthesis enzyme [Flavobacterium sp. N502540]|uniref:class 1 isoprenoid biosynthesis enzyme n=1 Tax=Flavobacterium sp. N502540 TaxID=2986838 RepID=UPI002224847D|nr:hypothetical protein [Flavobacterium sp. N502540]
MKFKNYVEGLDISDVFKKRILNIDFINANPVYYQNYPSLFANVFAIKKSSLDLLNIAGYFCYQSTLYVDDLIDEKELSVFPLISVCQEESIKLLTHLFGLKHPFWELWNSRKNEYFQAVLLEKELFKKKIVTIKEYEILADQKSAFGKVAIDCLYSLDSNCDTTLYEKLHLSHKYFSVAFQLNDDVKDLKEDIVNGQFNWAVALLKKENLTEKDPAILEKYLYLRGISKQMFLLGIEYCDKSLNIVKDIDVPKWKEIVEDFKKAFSKAIYEFENYLEVLVTEINMSKKIVVSNSIKESIPLAIQFIKSKQKDNGSWHEYINQGGISTVWSTSFILSKISANPHLKLVFKKRFQTLCLF